MGTITKINDDGSMIVQFNKGQFAIAHIRQCREIKVDRWGKVEFTDQKIEVSPNVGDKIACNWRGKDITKWTLETLYDDASWQSGSC